jgi:nucleotide-binding universal stress UspA family protein
MYKHILISTDGSEVAQRGVDQGLAFAKSLGAEVTIVTVSDRLPVVAGLEGGARVFAEYVTAQSTAAAKLLSEIKDAARDMGVAADTVHISDVQPAEAIIATAKTHHCQLIVMSSHGRRGLRRLVLGSVASEVVAHSPVPVLVVR